MKLLHLSDLHIGKRLHEKSFLKDQEYILDQILEICKQEQPDAVLIAGDVYDKSIPSGEAVTLFDDFLFSLSQLGKDVFIISGNHDSPERLSFGGRLMERAKIHFSPVYNGNVKPVLLSDEFGSVAIYSLPFIKPTNVRQYYDEEAIESYTDAVRVAIEKMNVDPSQRNVIVTHQFVTGAATCESEELSVGGTDQVDARVFDDFDYVALGHIHGPQWVERETIRYCGTPLKYSFSEATHKKSVTIVEMSEKGKVSTRTTPLMPLHDLTEIRGTFAELTDPLHYKKEALQNSYVRVILTDEGDIMDAAGRLRQCYPLFLCMTYDNTRTHATGSVMGSATEKTDPFEIFCEFFKQQNGADLNEEQAAYMGKILEEMRGDEK